LRKVAVVRDGAAKVSRKAEVDELDMMIRIQKNISGLQIPVHNALALQVLQQQTNII
jgi:hypothetical protein